MQTEKQTEAVIRRHLEAFTSGDVPALMKDYAEDVIFLSPLTGAMKGRAALEQLYSGLFRDTLPLATTKISITSVLIEGELGVVCWEAQNAAVKTQGAADTFVVRSGKIVGHTGVGSFVQP